MESTKEKYADNALLLELLTDKGIGTMVVGPDDVESFTAQPIGKFASKLAENLD